MSKQYIYDESGKAQFVVLPVAEYERLMTEAVSNGKSVPYRAGAEDDVKVPHEVVEIMVGQDVSLQAAWRIHCGLSQYDVAAKLGITQSAVSQWERLESKPQKKTRERLATLYQCSPEQLIL